VATFSLSRAYRYTLWREWIGGDGYCQFICLNPSTADEVQDDPTVRRCIAYAKAWGFGAFCMTNIFAFRATDPRYMKAQADPVGADNDAHIKRVAAGAGLIVAGWGEHGAHRGRAAEMVKMIPGLHSLRITRNGQPCHPLYLPKYLKPVPFEPQAPACPRCGYEMETDDAYGCPNCLGEGLD
jgi:hypothetical protein